MQVATVCDLWATMRQQQACKLFPFHSHREMRRISREELRIAITIQLTVQAKWAKTALQLSNSKIAVDTVAENILNHCLNGVVVLAPDLVSAGNWGDRPGKFGETEPWPFEEGHRPPKE